MKNLNRNRRGIAFTPRLDYDDVGICRFGGGIGTFCQRAVFHDFICQAKKFSNTDGHG